MRCPKCGGTMIGLVMKAGTGDRFDYYFCYCCKTYFYGLEDC